MDMESPRRRQSSDRTQPLGRSSGGVPAQASSEGQQEPETGVRRQERAQGAQRAEGDPSLPHGAAPPRPARAPEAGPSLADWLRTPRPEAEPGIWRYGYRPLPPEDPDRTPARQLLSGAVVAFLIAWLLWSLLYNGYLGGLLALAAVRADPRRMAGHDSPRRRGIPTTPSSSSPSPSSSGGWAAGPRSPNGHGHGSPAQAHGSAAGTATAHKPTPRALSPRRPRRPIPSNGPNCAAAAPRRPPTGSPARCAADRWATSTTPVSTAHGSPYGQDPAVWPHSSTPSSHRAPQPAHTLRAAVICRTVPLVTICACVRSVSVPRPTTSATLTTTAGRRRPGAVPPGHLGCSPSGRPAPARRRDWCVL